MGSGAPISESERTALHMDRCGMGRYLPTFDIDPGACATAVWQPYRRLCHASRLSALGPVCAQVNCTKCFASVPLSSSELCPRVRYRLVSVRSSHTNCIYSMQSRYDTRNNRAIVEHWCFVIVVRYVRETWNKVARIVSEESESRACRRQWRAIRYHASSLPVIQPSEHVVSAQCWNSL